MNTLFSFGIQPFYVYFLLKFHSLMYAQQCLNSLYISITHLGRNLFCALGNPTLPTKQSRSYLERHPRPLSGFLWCIFFNKQSKNGENPCLKCILDQTLNQKNSFPTKPFFFFWPFSKEGDCFGRQLSIKLTFFHSKFLQIIF